MSLGTLKLYKRIFLHLIVFGLFIGCSVDTALNTKPISSTKLTNKKSIDIKKQNNQKDKNTKQQRKITKKTTNITQPKQMRKSTELNKNHLNNFAFDLIKKGTSSDNTLLIVGGIQGDEPGGFMAASLMSTHYNITKGGVWIIPNLNFYSIIKRSRGPFGDMNRKFANLPKSDPEYKIIQRIKKYIKDPKVKLIVNLHDGSGYYRPKYIDKFHQPKKWGQSVVIDQDILPNVSKYNNTLEISEKIVKHLNKYLLKSEDYYRTKNTHTRLEKTNEEKQMAKTLTYYAINHGKSAFGHETSKSLSVAQRVYYKLLALEKFMDIMGIEYTKKFTLSVKNIKKALNDDISIKFDDTNVTIPLKDIRKLQKYFPINQDEIIRYLPSNPLIKIIKDNNSYIIYYGNNRLTKLQADYAEHLNFDTQVKFIVDGESKLINFGDTVYIKNNFLVLNQKDFRVNVIGYVSKDGVETGKKITKNMFIKNYSVEKNGKLFRVEYYRKNKFTGMILVKYK